MKLRELNDEKLIEAIKSNSCNDSFNELCRRYENVFYRICHKYTAALKASGVHPEDLYEEKHYILWTCASNFKPEKKTKLSTWIGNYARYICLNSINSRRLLVNFDNQELKDFIEGCQQSSYDTNVDPYQYENLKYCYDSVSDERLRKIITLRYFSGKRQTWKVIAKKMNISIQTAISLHNKVLKILKEKIKDKNNL